MLGRRAGGVPREKSRAPPSELTYVTQCRGPKALPSHFLPAPALSIAPIQMVSSGAPWPPCPPSAPV